MDLTCEKCGGPLAEPDSEAAEALRKALLSGVSVTLAHETCPGEQPRRPEGRYFEVRVSVVEVVEREQPDEWQEGVERVPEAVELLSFRCGTRAPKLHGAMRPLAIALGEKWQRAEQQAGIADSPTADRT